jgi:hypothetical protein
MPGGGLAGGVPAFATVARNSDAGAGVAAGAVVGAAPHPARPAARSKAETLLMTGHYLE